MSTAASVALLLFIVSPCGRSLLPCTLPPRKRLGIEHVRLCQRFFETTLEGLDRIGGTIGHGVLAELVLLPTQPDRVDRDALLSGIGDRLGKRRPVACPSVTTMRRNSPYPSCLSRCCTSRFTPCSIDSVRGVFPPALVFWTSGGMRRGCQAPAPHARCCRSRQRSTTPGSRRAA